jgi:hypothetical protein
MSTVEKKEVVISRSVSPKRDTLVVPPGARGAESMHPAHVHEPEVKVNPAEPADIDISKLIKRKKDEKNLKKRQERIALAGKAKNPSSSSSKSPKGRKPLTPRFEKIKARSVSPKGKGKGKGKGKEGKEHSGGGTRKKYKNKLRKTHGRKRR